MYECGHGNMERVATDGLYFMEFMVDGTPANLPFDTRQSARMNVVYPATLAARYFQRLSVVTFPF